MTTSAPLRGETFGRRSLGRAVEVTRDRDEIKAFARELGTIELKPLQGSGGQSGSSCAGGTPRTSTR